MNKKDKKSYPLWSVDRLKNDGTVLTKEYFERQLEKIREIRLSERKFHQKITDLYATALDYDATAKTTRNFYAKVQNKLHLKNIGLCRMHYSKAIMTDSLN